MFVELRCRSNLSFLTGASDAREYVRQAKLLSMPAIGITDLNGVYGLPRAHEALTAEAPDLKLICGADVRIEDHPRVSLIAKTRLGWGLLCRILSAVHSGKEKGEGFLTLTELSYLCTEFEGASDLFCLADVGPKANFEILKSLFGENLYLAHCQYLDGLDGKRDREVVDASNRFGISIVATNDVHYHAVERRPLQDIVTAIRVGKTVDTLGFDGFGNGERYLKSDLQMRALFQHMPDAIANTEKIATECSFKLTDLKYLYPERFVPEGLTSKAYLEQLVFEGAFKRYPRGISPEVSRQIRLELDFVFERNLEHFFLTNYDICAYARRQKIVYNARGSAVNSILCYCLFISGIDPIKAKLLFARFLNSARNEPPDIDIDFEHQRREEIIQFIFERYDRNHAAMVAAIQTYRDDGAFVEISKALGADIGTISARELQNKLSEKYGPLIYRTKFLPQLIDQIKDSPRHISTHPGGFLLSNEDLRTIVPIEPARMEGRTIIQWDKNDLETLGLMKVDILSIGFLTVMRMACDLVGISHEDIPFDDPETFEMICQGRTHGCFQIESRAQMNSLQRTLPRELYDLVINVALIRPLASKGGMVGAFLRGVRNHRRGIPFKVGNNVIERILGRTRGIPLFQEQMMRIAIEVAGFNDAEADQLRKAFGKHRSAESVDDMGKKLYAKLLEKGVDPKFADTLFGYVKGYASYGFPESHAASYAEIAYKSAYMKRHHPAELLVALFNSQPMGFYSIDTLMYEAQRNGVRIMPIHPNLSDWEAKLESPLTVRMGFQNVRGIREEPIRAMMKEREQKSFVSVEDFIARTSFNADTLENLALANIFDCWRLDRRHTFWQSLEFQRLIKTDGAVGQLLLFDDRAASTPIRNVFSKMSLMSEQFLDYRILGYSPKGNPMKGLRNEALGLPTLLSTDIRQMRHASPVQYAAIMTVIQRPPPAKGTAFITLEDEFGSIDATVRKEVYEQYRDVIRSSRFLIIHGRVQREERNVTILVSKVEAFGKHADAKPIRPQEHPRALGRIATGHAFEMV